jgi:hypothetical protein
MPSNAFMPMFPARCNRQPNHWLSLPAKVAPFQVAIDTLHAFLLSTHFLAVDHHRLAILGKGDGMDSAQVISSIRRHRQ